MISGHVQSLIRAGQPVKPFIRYSGGVRMLYRQQRPMPRVSFTLAHLLSPLQTVLETRLALGSLVFPRREPPRRWVRQLSLGGRAPWRQVGERTPSVIEASHAAWRLIGYRVFVGPAKQPKSTYSSKAGQAVRASAHVCLNASWLSRTWRKKLAASRTWHCPH